MRLRMRICDPFFCRHHPFSIRFGYKTALEVALAYSHITRSVLRAGGTHRLENDKREVLYDACLNSVSTQERGRKRKGIRLDLNGLSTFIPA